MRGLVSLYSVPHDEKVRQTEHMPYCPNILDYTSRIIVVEFEKIKKLNQ